MALPVKIMMVETKSYYPCDMCKDKSWSARYLFRFAQMIPDYVADELKICRKCVYREAFGTKTMNKAKKAKVLDVMNKEFNKVPKDF